MQTPVANAQPAAGPQRDPNVAYLDGGALVHAGMTGRTFVSLRTMMNDSAAQADIGDV